MIFLGVYHTTKTSNLKKKKQFQCPSFKKNMLTFRFFLLLKSLILFKYILVFSSLYHKYFSQTAQIDDRKLNIYVHTLAFKNIFSGRWSFFFNNLAFISKTNKKLNMGGFLSCSCTVYRKYTILQIGQYFFQIIIFDVFLFFSCFTLLFSCLSFLYFFTVNIMVFYTF